MEQYLRERIAYYETMEKARTREVIDDLKTLLSMSNKYLEVSKKDEKDIKWKGNKQNGTRKN